MDNDHPNLSPIFIILGLGMLLAFLSIDLFNLIPILDFWEIGLVGLSLILAIGAGWLIGQYSPQARRRHERDAATKASEQQFQLMFEEHGAIMLLIEPLSGQIVEANKAATRFYGYSKEQLRSMCIQDINTLSPEQVAAERQKAMRELRSHFIFPHRRADGSQRTVEVHSSPIRFREQNVLFSIIYDITERNQTEELVYAQRDLARITSSVTALDEALPLCLQIALRISGMDSGGFYFFDHSYTIIKLAYHTGLSENCAQAIAYYSVGSPRIQDIPLDLPSYYTITDNPIYHISQIEGLRSFAIIPIPIHEGFLGYIFVASHSLNDITSFSRHALEAIASEIGNVIIHLRTKESLEHNQHILHELNQTLEDRVEQRTMEVQDLYENAPVGYHSLDAEGLLIVLNQTQLNWLGYTREDLLGRPFIEILSPRSIPDFEHIFPLFKQQGSVRDLEFEMRKKNGTLMPVLISATAVYDECGNYLMSRSTVFDNTERKKAELALRETEERTRLLIESSPDAIVLFSEQGEVVQLNRAFEQMTGYTSAQMLGRTPEHIGLIMPDMTWDLALMVSHDLAEHHYFTTIDLQIQRANGEMLDVAMRVFGLTLQGQPHYLATLRDVTTEKHAEEKLRQANVALAHAARTKDEFLASMSHELRTPLNAILGLSEALIEGVRGPLNERQLDALHNIEASGQHLLALINDILDLSKVEAGRLDLQIEAVSVAEVCQASLLFVKEQALKKSLRLSFHLDDQMAEMDADPRRLKQMLVNLLSNAVKFTPPKGHVNLHVTIDLEAEQIVFVVEDTGIGIAQDDLPRLFQPFKQLDSRLSRQHEGTGLGLALVRRLAEMHGGGVMVESELGKGSRFSIQLPYRQPEMPNTTPDPTLPAVSQPVVARSPGRRILLVEDNTVNILTISDYLHSRGYTVAVANNGQEALDSIEQAQPELILMDIQMPVMDGIEATRRLRAMPAYSEIPIIALTALAMPGDRERCLAAGANAYLTKPISLRHLVQMIEEMVA
ncbi:two-component hybrid sensor and regulator [Oscillochloris trichoides DG-6]|uniref:Circadian input-output histidine kinase CikA n=1 Tax=Oscillochloris trichoides DG-6 TaxID=765420 RepID=E1IDL5_9CHLR|nr:PAS domain S-box protein [Oscillochloris trichoides]EFO80723.1 two-component hybrid sensor and regulator [Oscillochloris trichoides DG-6]